MKTLFMALTLLFAVNMATAQEQKTEAYYAGMKNGNYVFKTAEGEMMEFVSIKKSVSEQYDLTDKKEVRQLFRITYQALTDLDDNLNEVEVKNIIALERVTEVETIENSEEEDE